MKEQQVLYTHTNTYTTLNQINTNTKNVWFALHGLGYLTKYFANYFKNLDSQSNYIIAPQAPSKYYQDKRFKYVGASWLTKENTTLEINNVFNYLDQVWREEREKLKGQSYRLILMGYSQGVSIITRWMAARGISCDYLLLHSGAIPQDLVATHFAYLSPQTKVTYLYGDMDEYITEARKTAQQLKGSQLFGDRLTVTVFEGIHEVYTPFIESIPDTLDK